VPHSKRRSNSQLQAVAIAMIWLPAKKTVATGRSGLFSSFRCDIYGWSACNLCSLRLALHMHAQCNPRVCPVQLRENASKIMSGGNLSWNVANHNNEHISAWNWIWHVAGIATFASLLKACMTQDKQHRWHSSTSENHGLTKDGNI
jgi:hypothetical protein